MKKNLQKNDIVRAMPACGQDCRELTSRFSARWRISRRIKYISLLIAILFLVSILLLDKAKAADTSAYDCASEILDYDTTSIDDPITEFGPSQIQKGSKFTVLIQNQLNDYSFNWYYAITKDNKPIVEKNGSGGTPGITNIVTEEVSTNNLDVGNYNLKVKAYHKNLGCLLSIKNFSITIVKQGSIALVEQKSFNDGEVILSALNKNVLAGNTFKVNIDSNSKNDLRYEMWVNNLKTGQYLKKSAGTLKAGASVTSWATITTPGEHTVKVNILDTSGKSLYVQSFPASVTTSKAAQTSEEAAADPASASAETGSGDSSNPHPITQSDDTKVNPTLNLLLYGETVTDPAKAGLNDITHIIERAIQMALNFAGIVAFIMTLWGARIFLNSFGSPEALASGKKTLVWALVGFSTIIISKAILAWYVWDLQQVGVTLTK